MEHKMKTIKILHCSIEGNEINGLQWEGNKFHEIELVTQKSFAEYK